MITMKITILASIPADYIVLFILRAHCTFVVCCFNCYTVVVVWRLLFFYDFLNTIIIIIVYRYSYCPWFEWALSLNFEDNISFVS